MRSAALALATSLQLSAQEARPFLLPNRLQVRTVEDFGRPIVRVRLRIPLPPPAAGRPELTAFALDALDGSPVGSRSRGAFNRALDQTGLALRRHLEATHVTWELVGAPHGLEAGMSLLADLLLRPQLDGSAVERVRLRLDHDLETKGPVAHALRRARAALGAPGGWPPDETLLSLTGESELDACLRALLRPGGAALQVEGAVTSGQVRAAAMLHFGSWPEGPRSLPSAPPQASHRSTLVPGAEAFAWLGVELGSTASGFRELLMRILPAWLPSGQELEFHAGGFALTRSGGDARTQVAALAALLDRLSSEGVAAKDLDAAKRRAAAEAATLALHPREAGRIGMVLRDAPPAKEAGSALQLPAFLAELRRVLQPVHRRVMLASPEALDPADPCLAPYGTAEVWNPAQAAFVAKPKAPGP